MNNRGLDKENLLFILPYVLTLDQDILALADVEAELIAARLEEIDRLRIIPNIDALPEELLDILAYDFKVDWWDPEYGIVQKRRTLKDSWKVHKLLGTKAAVETAIRDVYPLSEIEEWFDYGGDPYHFRMSVNLTEYGGGKIQRRRVLDRVNFYKSLRSHCDGVRYFILPEKCWGTIGGKMAGEHWVQDGQIIVPELIKPGGSQTVTTGGTMAGEHWIQGGTFDVPELIVPGGSTTVTTGGKLTVTEETKHTAVDVPELTRPGATGGAAAGGTLAGEHIVQDGRVDVPELLEPGGSTEAIAGGALTVSREKQRGIVVVPELPKAGGRGYTGAGAAIFAYREIQQGNVNVPELAIPGGRADGPACAAVLTSREKVKTARAVPELAKPKGRAGRSAASGVFYSYQRQAVRIDTSNFTGG